MKELFANPGPALAMVLAIVVSFNIAMSGIKKALEAIVDKTATQVDNKALVIVNKVCSILAKIIDITGQNVEH